MSACEKRTLSWLLNNLAAVNVSDLEPMEPPVIGRQERFLQEPSAWETIKRQDNNHMFLRFGRRK